MDYNQLAEKLVKFLDLKCEPVAVKVIKKGEPIPEGYHEPDKNLRHCQSIMRARKGESFVIPADKHACVVAPQASGLFLHLKR